MPQREEHIGIVTDNEDPEQRGRVSVECPTIVAGDVIEWAEPEFHFIDSSQQAGSFFVPNPGSQVVLSIESEEDSEVTGLNARYKCAVYPLDSIPEEFRENYPHRRGWVTGAGHVMYFDDSDDDKVFLYKHPTGAEIQVTHDGEINVKPASGQAVNIGISSMESMVKGDTLETLLSNFITWANGHSHASHGAAPTVTFSGTTAGILSAQHKVGD
jgi:hypothetical protein